MAKRITRRNFLELGLTNMLSACAPKIAASATPDLAQTETRAKDTTLRSYLPDAPNILYTGRIDFSDARQPKFSAPGVYIRARFRGTGASVRLADQFQYGTNRNYYDAVIDDSTVVKIAPTPSSSSNTYEIKSDLPNAEHTLTLVKRTEASIGFGQFLGFEFNGEILPAPARPRRRMEFIGDSITCGTGDEADYNSPQCTEDGWGQPYNNVRLAFGPVLARSLGAEYQVLAVSGIGLTRNSSFRYDARPMPEVYDLLYFEQKQSSLWDTTKYVPDAVVIGLGTNDFSPGDSDRPAMDVGIFAAAYVKFIGTLRGYYPKADIFCVSSPMLGDHWPKPTDQSATDQKAAITKVVEEMNGRGDAKVHKFYVYPLSGGGCGTHPTADQHALLANQLGSYIAPVVGWS
jgi:lysophospholipase L1-like esterase